MFGGFVLANALVEISWRKLRRFTSNMLPDLLPCVLASRQLPPFGIQLKLLAKGPTGLGRVQRVPSSTSFIPREHGAWGMLAQSFFAGLILARGIT